MKILARISVGPRDVDAGLLARIRSVFPEQAVPRGFLSSAPLDDPRTQEVLGLLTEAGLRAWNFTKGQPRAAGFEYSLRYEREYDASDLAVCEYLELWPPSSAVHVDASSRTGSGMLILPQRKMPRGFAIMISHLYRNYFVTERAKAILEESRLRHVVFRPVSFRPKLWTEGDTNESISARHGRPYWEIDSNFTMPPLSHSMKLTDEDGNPWVRGAFSNGLQPREDLFLHPELHYRRFDLDRDGTFDLARVYEPFGNYRCYDRLNCHLVASKRFYETCVANNLITGWVPVRIDG